MSLIYCLRTKSEIAETILRSKILEKFISEHVSLLRVTHAIEKSTFTQKFAVVESQGRIHDDIVAPYWALSVASFPVYSLEGRELTVQVRALSWHVILVLESMAEVVHVLVVYINMGSIWTGSRLLQQRGLFDLIIKFLFIQLSQLCEASDVIRQSLNLLRRLELMS